MGKIFCLMGKSASGKDTVYNRLLQCEKLQLKKVIPYTTRPIRSGEKDKETYFFCSDEQAVQMEREGRIIEMRVYDTVYGAWKYFTAQDGQIDLARPESYLMIGTLEAYEKIRDYFGAASVVPLYLEVEDGLRLSRALARERGQAEPKYAELCRRFLADEADFSKEKLAGAGIDRVFVNKELNETVCALIDYIKSETALP